MVTDGAPWWFDDIENRGPAEENGSEKEKKRVVPQHVQGRMVLAVSPGKSWE